MAKHAVHPGNTELFSEADLTSISDKTAEFIQYIKDFNEFETATRHETVITEAGHSIDYFINEYWTSKQRAGLPLHEISYRACFKPQLPAFFIEHLTEVGDSVFDPFIGRGTTVLEAIRMGRRASGNDANPLSKILLEPRLFPPNIESIEKRLNAIPMDYQEKLDADLLTFFHPQTLKKIHALRDYFIKREKEGTLDIIDKWIRMVATNRLTGHSPGFFSVYTLPPNQAVSVARQRKINEDRKQIPPERDVRKIILRKTKSLLKNLDTSHKEAMRSLAADSQILCGSADATASIPDESINLVVTSPPFLATVDYQGDNWLRCWFNNIDPDRVHFWQLRKVEDWVAKMRATFEEFRRIVRPAGYVAFEVGEVNKGTVLLEQEILPVVEKSGFRPVLVLVNEQAFTKTSNAWGISNKAKGTNTNRVLLMQKYSQG